MQALGADVSFNDPHVAVIHEMREHKDLVGMRSVPLSAESLAGYDAVLIATHHAAYDWGFVREHAKLVVDTRGVMRDEAGAFGGVVLA